MIISAVSGARLKTALLPGAHAALPHKPGNPVLATAMAQRKGTEGTFRVFRDLAGLNKRTGSNPYRSTIRISLYPSIWRDATRGSLHRHARPYSVTELFNRRNEWMTSCDIQSKQGEQQSPCNMLMCGSGYQNIDACRRRFRITFAAAFTCLTTEPGNASRSSQSR